MSDGRLHGTVELYDEDKTAAVQVGSYSVPLESDPSAALAYRLEGAPIWDFEIAGFRRGDFSLFGNGNNGDSSGLYMLHPYHPGLIPVVFVHGTASSPARWAEMANELLGDPAIASHYQLWFFIYNSGNPIALSAMRLRESLQAVRKDVDPQGKDPALNQMVVIGHSQGGLLTKMMVVDSGNRFWNNVTSVPFDQAELDPETRDLASRTMFFKPLPFVTRVIFIATPHRGSFLASNPIVKLGNKFVNLPGGLAKTVVALGRLRETSMMGTPFTIPTALDNMDASNRFIKALSATPIAPGVKVNSIIPVKGERAGRGRQRRGGRVQERAYRRRRIRAGRTLGSLDSGHARRRSRRSAASSMSTPESIDGPARSPLDRDGGVIRDRRRRCRLGRAGAVVRRTRSRACLRGRWPGDWR